MTKIDFRSSLPTLALLVGLAPVTLGAFACADPEEPPEDSLLEPPAPGEGHQFAMTTELAPGVEAEHCKFVYGPPEGMYINYDEVRYTTGSHHFLLYETPYTTIPTENEYGEPVDTSGVFDCSSGPTDGWEVTKLIGGSQNANGDSIVSFPPGVAMYVRPGAVLLMNAHYINTSDEVLEPEVRINVYTIAEDEVTTPGDILFLYNPLISVPANSSARARWRCPVQSDITIANVQSHMHARGVDFAAMISGEEPFYTNTAWENVAVKDFDPGLEVAAGSYLEYYCDYENHEMRDVYQGPRSTDEMCMLIGSYYPADPRTANCLNETGNFLAGEWIGSGSASCAETLGCLEVAETLPALTNCMLAADPAVSKEASEVALCLVQSQDPQTQCATEIDACQAL